MTEPTEDDSESEAKTVDLAIVGAGAAGLMAAIWAGRTYPGRKIIALDGAAKLGAKILVAGGGRCNVTHDEVHESAYAGASRNAIKKVLRRFDVPQTIAFFESLGVRLKREATGKLFPVTDSARTVLNALLRAADDAGVVIQHPYRVESITRCDSGFIVRGSESWREIHTRAVILATGGRSLPKSGSDGHGYTLAQALGHSLTPRIFPALVPLTLPRDHILTTLSGISVEVTVTVHSKTGKALTSFTGSLLCTHFGLSGPVILDISRYFIDSQYDDLETALSINWLPGQNAERVEGFLRDAGKTTILRYLLDSLPERSLPERLARALCAEAGLESSQILSQLTRQQRTTLVDVLARMVVPVTGNRGYTYAEVTAGGVPLNELELKTMESRLCPGLHLCGEICDVDGRIGGYNFQWAWASGYVAGISVNI